MKKYLAYQPIDYAKFAPSATPTETLYGLPLEVKYCKKCTISNQRPNSAVEFKHTKDSKKQTIHFDEHGVCDACRTAERKTTIDWDARDAELRALCDRFRRSDGHYDVLVPGSGGKDSFYAAHMLKYKYGMNPLTVTFAPHIYTEWGWKNQQAWIHAGFDNYTLTPNGHSHRLLTRLAVENLLHPFQPFMLGQKNMAPRLATLFKIPLVVYGENEAEYGNPIGDMDEARRSHKYFVVDDPDKAYLGGVSVSELKAEYGLKASDLEPFMPVAPERLEELGVEVHYLGYYLKWHPQSCYYYAVEHGGFQASPERTAGTYSKYNSIDDKIDDLHYYTTRLKFGIGRAVYDASQEIRSGDITREEGLALIRRFDDEIPERFMAENLEYLSLPEQDFPQAARFFEKPILDRAYFDNLCDRFRSPHLWQYEDGKWSLRHPAWAAE
jgi:N-acetyl sugar amidotransferase